MFRKLILLSLLLHLSSVMSADAAEDRIHDWRITWSHPTSAERFDVVMHTAYGCTLTVTNHDDGFHRFTYGLDWDVAPYDVLGDVSGSGFFQDHTSVIIDGSAYAKGDTLIDWFGPQQTKSYVFQMNYDWVWLEPWSAWRLLEAAASFLPGSSEYRLIKAAASVGDAWTIMSILRTQFVMVPECVFELRGIETAAGDGVPLRVDAWVKEEKVQYLGSSLINTVAGSAATKIGYACLASGPWGAVPAAAFFVVEACNLAAAEYYYVCAYDPVEDYDVIVQPEPWSRPDLEFMAGGAARDMAEDALDLPALAKAELQAYARAAGAAAAGDRAWERRQRAAARTAAARQASLLRGMSVRAAALLPDIAEHDDASIMASRDSLMSGGLPSIERDILAAFGWDETERESVIATLLAADNENFANCRTIAEELADAAAAVERVLDPDDPQEPLAATLALLPSQMHVEEGPHVITCRLTLPDRPWSSDLGLSGLVVDGNETVDSWTWENPTPDAPAVALLMVDLAALDMEWRVGEFLIALDGRADADPFFACGLLTVLEPGAVVVEDPGPPPEHLPRPAASHLVEVHPNPFNPSVTVDYELSAPGDVRIEIFALDGARTRSLLDDRRPAGPGSVAWNGCGDDGRRAPAGTYVVVLRSSDGLDVRKIVLVK